MLSATNTGRRVVLRAGCSVDTFIGVDSADHSALGALSTIGALPGGRSLGNGQAVRLPMYSRAEQLNGEICVQARDGLRPLILEVLARRGVAVELSQPPRLYLGEPSPASRPMDSALLDNIRAHDRLLVRVRPEHVDVSCLVAQMHWTWPSLRLLIAVSSRAQASAFVARLRQLGVPAMQARQGLQPEARRAAVVVSVFNRLGGTDAEVWNRDLIIVPDATTVIRSRGLNNLDLVRLGPPHHFRFVGFVDAGRRIPLTDADRLLQVFGFPRLYVPTHGHSSRPVRVVILPLRGGRPAVGLTIPLDVKRRLIWRDGFRNRHVGRIANLLRNYDHAAVARQSDRDRRRYGWFKAYQLMELRSELPFHSTPLRGKDSSDDDY